MLQIHNSLTRAKEVFVPLTPGVIRMYVCGMTVYDLCHLGHARVFVVFDMATRWLRASGYQVEYVRNITDIDDKIIKRAAENGETPGRADRAFHRGDAPGRTCARRAAARPRTARHRLCRADAGADRPADRQRPGLSRAQWRCLLQRAGVSHLRPAVGQKPRRTAGRRARGNRPQQARSDGFRAVESRQARRAGMGIALGLGPSRLAHRMLGDERRPARQAFRHPRRRPGPAVSPPRKRNRPVRRRARLHLRQLLDAQRLRAGGQRENVQVARQLLHHPRSAGEIRRRSGALFHPARALPQSAQLFRRPSGRRQRRADPACIRR